MRARVTAGMTGGAGEKTGWRRAVDMERRLNLPVPSLESTQILFCHHFAHMLTTTTLVSPPPRRSTIPIKTTNGVRTAPNSPLSLLVLLEIHLLFFPFYVLFMRDVNCKREISGTNSHKIISLYLFYYYYFFFYKA